MKGCVLISNIETPSLVRASIVTFDNIVPLSSISVPGQANYNSINTISGSSQDTHTAVQTVYVSIYDQDDTAWFDEAGGAFTSPTDDYDGDGFSDRYEYLLGLDPTIDNSGDADNDGLLPVNIVDENAVLGMKILMYIYAAKIEECSNRKILADKN